MAARCGEVADQLGALLAYMSDVESQGPRALPPSTNAAAASAAAPSAAAPTASPSATGSSGEGFVPASEHRAMELTLRRAAAAKDATIAKQDAEIQRLKAEVEDARWQLQEGAREGRMRGGTPGGPM